MPEDCNEKKKVFEEEQKNKLFPVAPRDPCGEKVEEKGKVSAKPEDTPKIPDELKEPPPETWQEEEELLLPKPIRIFSLGIRVECEQEGTEGEGVEVSEGAFSSLIFFSSVLSIKEEVLDYIARKNLEPIIEKSIHDHSLTPKELRKLTGMTLRQAREFLEIAYTTQAKQDEYARAYAESRLVCLYWNTPQTETCLDEGMAHPEDHEGAVFSATVEGHTFSSAVSQEQADAEAKDFAQNQLNCFYVNDQIEVDCADWPERPVDYTEKVPNDAEEVYPGKGLRVGHIVIPPGEYASYESKEAANEEAKWEAYSRLVCWFPNDPVHLQCEDPEARGHGVIPSQSPAQHADPDTGRSGQIVDIPEGYITSELSREDATREAQMLAESLLECCWVNDPFVLRCEPQEVHYKDGSTAMKEPDPEKGVIEVRVEEGEYTSCNSKEEANMLARQMTEGLLDCRYCNERVLPECVPTWVIEGVLNKKITLPLQEVITDGVHTVLASSLPPEASIGVEKDAYCDTDAQMAQDIAEYSAGVAIKGTSSDCIYASDAVYATCSGVDPITGREQEANKVHYLAHPETGESYIFYTMYPPGTCLADDFSRPPMGDYISNPAGLFSMAGENAKEECNRRSLELALSQLFCVWTNPETIGVCDGTEYALNCCDKGWEVNRGVKENILFLTDWSSTKENPVILPRGYIQYVGTGSEEEDPFSIIWPAVKEYVLSMILCIYTNAYQSAMCEDLPEGPPGVKYLDDCGSAVYTNNGATGVVEEGTIYAETFEEANATAKRLAKSMASCDINTVMVWGYDYYPPETPNKPKSSPVDGPGPIPPNPPDGPGENCCFGDCPYYGKENGENQKKGVIRTQEIQLKKIGDNLNTIGSQAISHLLDLREKVKKLEHIVTLLENGQKV